MAMHYVVKIPVEDVVKAFVEQYPRHIFQKSVLVETDYLNDYTSPCLLILIMANTVIN